MGAGWTRLWGEGEPGSSWPPELPQALLWTLCWRPGPPRTGSGNGRLSPSCLFRKGGRAPLAGSCVDGGPCAPGGQQMGFLELITACGPETTAARGWAALRATGGSGWEGHAASGVRHLLDSGLRVLQVRWGKTV